MLLATLFLVPLIFPQAAAPPAAAPEAQHLVRVELTAARDAARLASLNLDVVRLLGGADSPASAAEVIVDDRELARLRALDWRAEVVIRDLASYYADRLAAGSPARGTRHGSWLTPPFGSGGMGGYYTFDEITAVLDQIQSAYPTIVAPRVSLGQSVEGRDLWMVKVSDNPGLDESEPEARLDSLHHAREPQGMQCALWFLLWLVEEYGADPLATYLVEERELFFIPCVNPDGYVYNQQTSPTGGGMWRKNRLDSGGGVYGVDLNRNYPFQWGYDDYGSSPDPSSNMYRGPSAGSEPETAAMLSFIQAREFGTALSIHCYGGKWLCAWGYIAAYPPDWAAFEEIGDLATEWNGYPNGPASFLAGAGNGDTLDYDYGVEGALCWSPEIGNNSDGFWPPPSRIVPLAEENRLAFARTALAAGAWVRAAELIIADAGDGDGSFEGGELVEITVPLRNSGLALSPAVSLDLLCSHPRAELRTHHVSPGAIPSLADGPNTAPLSLRIVPGTAAGEVIDFQVTVTAGPWSEVLEGEVQVGAKRIVAAYDFEAPGDEGWTVGDPNNASTGNWVRVDPNGTDAQPEDDHTPGAGAICWVTGQGSPGGGNGTNDVDGGRTSLWSPTFNLVNHLDVRLEYWRWFSNDEGSAPSQDIFVIEISNDGGQNWFEAEVVGPTGPEASGGWWFASIDIEAVLPLSDRMRVRFVAADMGDGSIVEAAIDDVVIHYLGEGDCPAPRSYCTSSPNSVGAGALMGIGGSTGVSDADFTLLSRDLPPNEFGVFFFGEHATSVPFGDGVRCISAPVFRLPVIQIDPSGLASFPIDFGATPAAGRLLGGTSWRFQFWYRDPGFGTAGFNLSDGLEVSFCD